MRNALLLLLAACLSLSLDASPSPSTRSDTTPAVPQPTGPIVEPASLQDARGNAITVLRLSNGGTTLYFDAWGPDMNNLSGSGQLVDLTNPGGRRLSYAVPGVDSTGIFQDWEVMHPKWRGSSDPLNPPYDFCSILAYIPGRYVGGALTAEQVSARTEGGDAVIHVQTFSRYEYGWGDTPTPDTYDPGDGARFFFDIEYRVKPDGVARVTFTVKNPKHTQECFPPWISFPFVLVSPAVDALTDPWVFESGDTLFSINDLYFDGGTKRDAFFINDPTSSPLPHGGFPQLSQDQSTRAPACSPARVGRSTGPYTVLNQTQVNGNGLGRYIGLHGGWTPFGPRWGVVAQVPSGTRGAIMEFASLGGDRDDPTIKYGLYEFFLETFLPVGRTANNEFYTGTVHFIPWGDGRLLGEAKDKLSLYTSSITSPSNRDSPDRFRYHFLVAATFRPRVWACPSPRLRACPR